MIEVKKCIPQFFPLYICGQFAPPPTHVDSVITVGKQLNQITCDFLKKGPPPLPEEGLCAQRRNIPFEYSIYNNRPCQTTRLTLSPRQKEDNAWRGDGWPVLQVEYSIGIFRLWAHRLKSCSKWSGSTINAGGGFHYSSALSLFFLWFMFIYLVFACSLGSAARQLLVSVLNTT